MRKKIFNLLAVAAVILFGISIAYALPDFLGATEYRASGLISSKPAYVCNALFTDINWTSQDRIQLLNGTTSAGTSQATIAASSQNSVPVPYNPCLYFPTGIYLQATTQNVNWSADLQWTNTI